MFVLFNDCLLYAERQTFGSKLVLHRMLVPEKVEDAKEKGDALQIFSSDKSFIVIFPSADELGAWRADLLNVIASTSVHVQDSRRSRHDSEDDNFHDASENDGSSQEVDEKGRDDALQKRIATLQMPSGTARWMPSRSAFKVGASPGGKHLEWRTPRKAHRDPPTFVKWLAATRKAINRYEADGTVAKVRVEDLGDTDDDA